MKKKIMIFGFLVVYSMQATLELRPQFGMVDEFDDLPTGRPVELTPEEAELPMRALPFFGLEESVLPMEASPVAELTAEEANLPMRALPIEESLIELTPEEAELPMRALPIEKENSESALPIRTLPVEVMPVPTISIDGDVIKSISVPVGGPQVQADKNIIRFIDGSAQINAPSTARSLLKR